MNYVDALCAIEKIAQQYCLEYEKEIRDTPKWEVGVKILGRDIGGENIKLDEKNSVRVPQSVANIWNKVQSAKNAQQSYLDSMLDVLKIEHKKTNSKTNSWNDKLRGRSSATHSFFNTNNNSKAKLTAQKEQKVDSEKTSETTIKLKGREH